MGLILVILLSGCASQTNAPQENEPTGEVNTVPTPPVVENTGDTQTQNEEAENILVENPVVEVPEKKPIGLFGQECEPSGPAIFDTPPLSLDKLEFIDPLGRMAASHVTPTDHQYWQPVGFEHSSAQNKTVQFDVVSPAKGYIIEVGEFGPGDYRLILEHSCNLYTIFIHLYEVPEKIASQKDVHPMRIPVEEGEVIGRKDHYSFDFSVHDTQKSLTGFVFPEHYGEVWKIHTVDPFDYFSEPLATQLREKSLRSAEPMGGKIDYDIPNTIQGTWFRQGTGTYESTNVEKYWKNHLALAYDYIDPTQLRISLGDYAGTEATFGVKGNKPLFSEITKDDGMVALELTEYDYFVGNTNTNWDRKSHAKLTAKNTGSVKGVLLVQHLDNHMMKVEAFPGKDAAQVSGFTSQAEIYER